MPCYESPCSTDSPSIGGVSSFSSPAIGPIVGGIFNGEIDSFFIHSAQIITGVLGGLSCVVIVILMLVIILVRCHKKSRDDKNQS